ncbi:MAG: YfhO family protein [Deltaproteobacteria bacterium]|nr:YfhO family protein [Deltaproteobacteria bacterium]
MIKGGQLPLWNPYFYGGQPLLATLQPGVLYPPNILLLLLPFDLGFNLIIVFHFFLAGIFTYFFIKSLKGSDMGAFIGALAFMFSGYLLSVHNLLPHLLSVAWLPLILLCYQKYLKRGALRFLVLTSVCLTIMFLGGAVEILYGTFILIFVLLFFPDPFGVGMLTMPILKKRVISFGLVIFLVVLLSAVQLLPFLELAFNSIRAGGLSYEEAITWSLDFKDLVQFFVPDPYGYGYSTEKYWSNQSWLKTIYLGIIPFALSVFFVVEKRRKVIPFLVIMFISLILSFGGNTPVYKFLYLYVPFLNTIRYPVKFLFIFVFLISVMAGMGCDSLCRQISDKNTETKGIIHGFLVFSVFAALLWGILNFYEVPIQEFLQTKGFAPPEYNDPKINLHNIKRFLLLCLFFGPVLVFGWNYPKRRTIFSFVLLFLLSLDLFFANKGYYQKYDAESFHKPSESVSFLKKDTSIFRILTTPKTTKEPVKYSSIFSDSIKVDKEKILPGFNIEHRIYCMDGSEVIRLKNYETIRSLIYGSPKPDSTNLLALLNVKYIISKFKIDSPEFELARIIGDQEDDEGSLRIYRNLNVLPRAFLVDKYKVVGSEKAYRNILQSKTFDPRELVLLDKDPFDQREEPPFAGVRSFEGTGLADQPVQPSGDEKEGVIMTKYETNRIELAASLNKPKFLFLSESYYPGWKVYVDGVKGEIYRANYAFRGVPLAPGRHEVLFVYDPLSFKLGMALTLLGLAVCTALFWKRKNGDFPGNESADELAGHETK